jgi:hypothetical protein
MRSVFTGSLEIPLTLEVMLYVNKYPLVRFQVLTAASMMFTAVFWAVLHHDGGSMHLWNVGRQSIYTAVQPRRQLWTSIHSRDNIFERENLIQMQFKLHYSLVEIPVTHSKPDC